MNDETMTQEQKDAAAVIEEHKQRLGYLSTLTTRQSLSSLMAHDEIDLFTDAALRTIDAQAAELDALRARAAAYDALRAAVDGVPELIDQLWHDHMEYGTSYELWRETINRAASITDALNDPEIPDTSALDAAPADGSGTHGRGDGNESGGAE